MLFSVIYIISTKSTRFLLTLQKHLMSLTKAELWFTSTINIISASDKRAFMTVNEINPVVKPSTH